MITKLEVDELMNMAKEAIRTTKLYWFENERYDEQVISVGGPHLTFCLSLSRNPHEIRAHFRIKGSNIQLARIDNHNQHWNPDGEVLQGPHLHYFREGYDLIPWAEEIDWYDLSDPIGTLSKFLDIIHTRFPHGVDLPRQGSLF